MDDMEYMNIYNLNNKQIKKYIYSLARQELMEFLIKENIPFKRYHSLRRMREDAINNICCTAMFKRIGG